MKYNIILSCLGLSVALSSATSPFLIGNSINLYLSHDRSYILIISTACLLILVTPALRLSANIYLQKISSNTTSNIKRKLLRVLFTTHFSADRRSGELLDLVDGDVDGAIYLYHGIFLDITINASLIALALLMIAYYYPAMIIAPLAGIFYSIAIYLSTKNNSNRIYTEYVTENTITIGKICDLLKQPNTSYSDQLREDEKKINKLALFSNLKISVLAALSGTSYLVGITTMLLIGFYAMNNNIMDAGMIFASAMYVERVLTPTSALISIYFSSREAFCRRSRIHNNIM